MRDAAQLQSVLAALDRWREHIALSGVEVYEGILNTEEAVRALLERAVDLTRQLLREHRFDRQPSVLSGAGSVWYDVVAEVFSAADLGDSVDIVLRPGCYLTHDAGVYRAGPATDRNAQPHRAANARRPAAGSPALGLCAIGAREPEEPSSPWASAMPHSILDCLPQSCITGLATKLLPLLPPAGSWSK